MPIFMLEAQSLLPHGLERFVTCKASEGYNAQAGRHGPSCSSGPTVLLDMPPQSSQGLWPLARCAWRRVFTAGCCRGKRS